MNPALDEPRGDAAAPEVLPALLHRLSSPMGTIVNTLFLLEEDPSLPQSARDALGPLRRASDALTRTLADARRLLDAQEQPLDPEPIDAGALLTAALEARGDVALTIRAEGSAVAWACAEGTRLAFDELVEALAPFAGAEPLAAHIRPTPAGAPMQIAIDVAHAPWADAALDRPIEAFEAAPAGGEPTGAALGVAATLLARMGGALRRERGPDGGGRLVVELPRPEADAR